MTDTARIEDLKRRVQSDPASIAFAALAEEYRRAGRFEEAIAVCTAGLVRHPSYLSAHVTLGRALIEVGRFDDAREELQYVLNLAPENLAAIRGLADIHHRLGEDMHEQFAAADQARYGVGGTETAEETAAPPAPPPPEPHPFTEAYAEAAAAVAAPPIVSSAPAAAAVPIAPPVPIVPAVKMAAPAPPPSDPAIERLEGFLHAVMRARAGGAAAAG